MVDLSALQERARELLGPGAADYFDGGADDELTLRESEEAWRRLRLRPHVLRDVSTVTTGTTVLGTRVAAPVLAAPSAAHGLAHPEAELATARGCAAAGSLMVVSTRGSTPLEEVAREAGAAPAWFQVYIMRDRELTAEMVRRVAAAGYTALVLTVDAPLLGRRLRDVRNGYRLPPAMSLVNLGGDLAAELERADRARQDPAVTPDDIDWLAELSGLPVVVKGVLRGDDAILAVEAGAAAVWVSNHGGRQLDGTVVAAEVVPEIVAAVGNRVEVYADGGIRRGTDVLKALALGARAAFVGRPVLWGLAVDGAGGVRGVLDGLRDELALAMALAGCPTLDAVTHDLLAPARTG